MNDVAVREGRLGELRIEDFLRKVTVCRESRGSFFLVYSSCYGIFSFLLRAKRGFAWDTVGPALVPTT